MDLIRARARALRKNPTEAEKVLWGHLRFWQVEGYKFRRQEPLGKYVVDFVFLEKKLIIELDGGQHAEQSDYDAKRDAWLSEEGFTVLRFWNNNILKNIEGVTEKIFQTLKSTPSSILPRKETVSQLQISTSGGKRIPCLAPNQRSNSRFCFV